MQHSKNVKIQKQNIKFSISYYRRKMSTVFGCGQQTKDVLRCAAEQRRGFAGLDWSVFLHSLLDSNLHIPQRHRLLSAANIEYHEGD